MPISNLQKIMIQNDTYLKQCCTAVYQSEWARLLLGDSFHPGGLELTARLGELVGLRPSHRVLDVASGVGTTAVYLAEQFGCTVVGVDLGAEAVAAANDVAAEKGLTGHVWFDQGDAEQLPFPDASFDIVVCECAFCTFPNKPTAAAELARVLKLGGQLALSDITRSGTLPPELDSLMAWIACLADAQSVEEYTRYLETAAFTIRHTEQHNAALDELVRTVRAKLLGIELMANLQKAPLPDLDFDQARTIARHAAEAVRQGKLGYAVLIANKT